MMRVFIFIIYLDFLVNLNTKVNILSIEVYSLSYKISNFVFFYYLYLKIFFMNIFSLYFLI